MDQPTPDSSHEARRYHEPVMVDEVAEYLAPASEGWIVDGTFGGGGHAHALLERFPHVHVVGIDRDPDALGEAQHHPRLRLIRGNSRDLVSLLADNGLPSRVEGILLDLGVSSHQLDVAERGFSYHTAGPLDMRMGPDALRTAGELIDDVDADELADILRRFGDEPHARRIASAIVANRPFASTTDLARCIAEAVPAAARRGKHPARRTFQALRIAVNDELAGLGEAIAGGIASLAVGGRFVVMSYHSLEDRLVKRTFVEHARTCTCPPGLPQCVCGAAPDLRLVSRRGIRPTDAEVERNPRARSATLRVAERIAT